MKQILLLLVLLCATSAFAQDVIVKKNGSTVVCRVVEVNSSEVVFKKWSNLEGANYVINRSDISAINYENGRKETLSAQSVNEFAPNNQNTGLQSLNDNALLKLDNDTHQYTGKAKKLRTIGWVGGAAFLTGSAVCVSLILSTGCGFWGDSAYKYGEAATILGVAGIAWTTGFLLAASRQQKMASTFVMNNPMLQNEFTFNNGTSLMCSADLIQDNLKHKHTFGIGLRYNF